MGVLTNVVSDASAFSDNLQVEDSLSETFLDIRTSFGKESANVWFKQQVADAAFRSYNALPKRSLIVDLFTIPRLAIIAAAVIGWAGFNCWRSSSERDFNAFQNKLKAGGLVDVTSTQGWIPVTGTHYGLEVKDLRQNDADGSKLTVEINNKNPGDPLTLYVATYDEMANPIGTASTNLSHLGKGIVVGTVHVPADGAKYISLSSVANVAAVKP
jgi:hypothetical protein